MGSHLELACIGCTRHPNAGDQRKWVISERRSAFACCKRASRSRTGCLRTPHRYAVLWPYCHRLHHLLVPFATQVARSVRIRSRCLAIPTGKGYRRKRSCTQRPETTSGCMPIRACCQSAGCPQIPLLPMRTARGERQPKCSMSTGTGRARMRRSVALC